MEKTGFLAEMAEMAEKAPPTFGGTKSKVDGVWVELLPRGGVKIAMFEPGFNSPTNNSPSGYKTVAAAVRASKRYAARRPA